MTFLQEAIAAGPVLLILAGVVIGLILAGCVAIYNIKSSTRHKSAKNDETLKPEEKETISQSKETRPNNNSILYIIIFVCFGLAIIIMNWLCNLQLD